MGKDSSPAPTNSTVTQTTLPEYAQPYVTDIMQQAQGLSRRPYEANPNPRIAPFSGDQLSAFDATRNLGTVGQAQYGAANGNLGLATLMQAGAGYNPNQITSGYTSSTYNPASFTNQNVNAQNINAQQVGAQQVGAQNINAQQVGTGQWNNAAALQYMDPFLRQVADTTLARNEDLFSRDQIGRNSRAARSGAFGGLRQGVEDAVARSEFGRNTAEREAALLSQGYNTAFQGFTSDQARGLQASLANQGADLEAQRANQGAGLQASLANQGADLEAQRANQSTSLEAQRANQSSGLQAALANQSTDMERQRMQEASRQFGANFDETSQRALNDYFLSTQNANESNAARAAQMGQSQAQGLASIGAQFGALGDQQRQAEMQNIDMLRSTGLDQQRQTQASLDLANEDFINQRDYPLQMLNFYNSIIRGMPISSNSNVVSYEQSNPYSQFLGLGLGAAGLSNALGGRTG